MLLPMRFSARVFLMVFALAAPACKDKVVGPSNTTSTTTSSTSTSTSTSTTSTTSSTTTSVPTGAAQFDGTYRGTFAGVFSGLAVNGPVEFSALNGRLTVTMPANGTGTVDATGSANFGGTVSDLGTTCTFGGTFTVTSGVARANGTWGCGTGSGGTWNATRN